MPEERSQEGAAKRATTVKSREQGRKKVKEGTHRRGGSIRICCRCAVGYTLLSLIPTLELLIRHAILS